jgi:2-methylisocitrate lyase-like PEP mutase family enzyme
MATAKGTAKSASLLKSLHKPGNPIVFANVYDALTARTVGGLPNCKALATASYAVALVADTKDDDMTFEQNLAAAKSIAKVARDLGKPFTLDAQDCYGDRLEEFIRALVREGVAGVNLEDCDKESGKMHSVETAVSRVAKALEVAKAEGVDDFVVNARCDTLIHGGELDEVIERGKKYLDAGATTVFVWGGSIRGGISKEEVVKLVKAFDGRLNVSLKMEGGLSVQELKDIGVARISVGPAIQFKAMDTFKQVAGGLLA